MAVWIPEISKMGGPRYLALASAIAEAINSGELPAGAQLPPQRDLAKRLGVTVGTVGRAYTIIKKRNLVMGEVGRGTFVRGNEGPGAFATYIPERKPGTIDLVCFRIPVDEVANCVSETLSEIAQHTVLLPLVNYPPAVGYITHRTAGATWIKRSGLNASPDGLIACAGGQQAILAAITALANLDGPILTECVTYSGMKSIAALRAVDVEGVAIDNEGIIPDALEERLAKVGGRVVYLQPTIHNPVGMSMSEGRRRKLAGIAQAKDLIIIEDDVAAAGLTDRPPPIAAFAPERTIYITSLSKCISPALRTGFIATPATLIERLTTTIHSLSLGAPPLLLETASLIIMNGSADRIAARNNQELARRHAIVQKELAGLHFISNPGAFFVWLTLPEQWTSAEFVERAQKEGVSIVCADNFSIGEAEPPRAVRLSLNPSPNLDALVNGLRTIRRLIEERPMMRLAVV